MSASSEMDSRGMTIADSEYRCCDADVAAGLTAATDSPRLAGGGRGLPARPAAGDAVTLECLTNDVVEGGTRGDGVAAQSAAGSTSTALRRRRGDVALPTRRLYHTGTERDFIGPILWGHSGHLCHALSLLSSLSWTSMRACDSSDTW